MVHNSHSKTWVRIATNANNHSQWRPTLKVIGIMLFCGHCVHVHCLANMIFIFLSRGKANDLRKILENNDWAKEKVASEAKDIESEVVCKGLTTAIFCEGPSLQKPNGIMRNVRRNCVISATNYSKSPKRPWIISMINILCTMSSLALHNEPASFIIEPARFNSSRLASRLDFQNWAS